MGFMLGDPFNYSPIQKMAESVTFRTAADGKPNCNIGACGNADATARPYTLKQYYQEDMQSGGDSHHNRPFYRFFVRGDTEWKDDDYTLKLHDIAGDDGATKLDVESGWLVKLKIGFKTGNNKLGTSDETFNDMVADKLVNENPNILRVDNEASDAGYFYTIVLLDGDEGDYVSIDLDAEHADIGQFVIKAGGIKYSDSSKIDYGSSDQDARVELLGVSYKPYFEGDDDTDDDSNDDTDDDSNDDDDDSNNDDNDDNGDDDDDDDDDDGGDDDGGDDEEDEFPWLYVGLGVAAIIVFTA